jgi:hypothetical protein
MFWYYIISQYVHANYENKKGMEHSTNYTIKRTLYIWKEEIF